jgi:hypothetical protein
MNAKEKAAILKQAGYFYTTSNFASTKHRWYQGEGEALSASPWIAAGETFAAATNATYGLYLQAKSATPATVVKAIEHPADILREKNALIASQAAEIARKTELLKRIYALPYIKDIAISILIEDELGMNDPENSPKFAEHFKRQAPAPAEAPASGITIIDHDGTEYKTTVDDFVAVAKSYSEAPAASEAPKPKFSVGDLVFYYGDVMVVGESDLINGLYAYELQRLDNGDILGAMIAETELDPA